MKLTITKFLLLVAFIICFVTFRAVAWDDEWDEDWDEDWDKDWEEDDCNENDWDRDNDGWDHDKNGWDRGNDGHGSDSTWYPVPTYGQSTGYYPTGIPVTVTTTYTQVYTSTVVPSYTDRPQTGDASSIKTVGIPLLFVASAFNMLIAA